MYLQKVAMFCRRLAVLLILVASAGSACSLGEPTSGPWEFDEPADALNRAPLREAIQGAWWSEMISAAPILRGDLWIFGDEGAFEHRHLSRELIGDDTEMQNRARPGSYAIEDGIVSYVVGRDSNGDDVSFSAEVVRRPSFSRVSSWVQDEGYGEQENALVVGAFLPQSEGVFASVQSVKQTALNFAYTKDVRVIVRFARAEPCRITVKIEAQLKRNGDEERDVRELDFDCVRTSPLEPGVNRIVVKGFEDHELPRSWNEYLNERGFRETESDSMYYLLTQAFTPVMLFMEGTQGQVMFFGPLNSSETFRPGVEVVEY